jgi:hypothetical protein
MMRRGACLDADQAGRQLLEEREHIPAPQLATDDNTAARVDAVNLKD